jgi:hypothetical protein
MPEWPVMMGRSFASAGQQPESAAARQSVHLEWAHPA